MRYMVCVLSVRRVTWNPASRTWLKRRCWRLDFFRIVNRGDFCEFYVWFFMNAAFISRSASVFSRYHTRVSKCLRPWPQLAIWIKCSDWSLFEFLVRDFPKTSCTGHIARSILSSLPLLSTLGAENLYSSKHTKLTSYPIQVHGRSNQWREFRWTPNHPNVWSYGHLRAMTLYLTKHTKLNNHLF